MSDTHHRQHSPDPADVRVRDVDIEDDAGRDLFAVRMPVTSTAEARDGDAFDRERVAGFAEQIREKTVPVFLDHGRNEATGSRYSALGKIGYLAEPEVVDREAATDVDADFVMVDPEAAPEDTPMRAALATIRAQAEAGIPPTSSIGWSEDTGERDLPGDADLLEASIVGIPSDSRTTTDTTNAAGAAMARAAGTLHAETDMDAGEVADALRDTIDKETVKAASPVHVDGEATTTDAGDTRDEYEVGDTTIDLTPPDRIENAASLGLAKKDEFADAIGDCGTGVGEDMAQAILDDGLTPEIVANGGDIASNSPATYLASHESDLDADGTPSEWGEEEWTGGCAEVQQALWGFYEDWFADREQAVEEAREEADEENAARATPGARPRGLLARLDDGGQSTGRRDGRRRRRHSRPR
jgi:hypothetical protein